MSIFKKIKKATSSVTKAVSNAVKSVGGGVEKIAQGKVGEGLGDIGQAAARVGLDTVTGGNKNLVDGFSGGLLTSAEGAARGNTEDLTRIGVTGGAALAGGPAAAFAVNQGFSNGGGLQGALVSGIGFVGVPGAEFIANGVTNIVGGKSKVQPSGAPMIEYAPEESYSPSAPKKSNSMLLIGGAVVGVTLILLLVFLSFRKRKR